MKIMKWQEWNLLCIALVAVLLSGGCAKHVSNNPPPAPNKDWTITETWRVDFTNYVPCSATVTKGCVSGFTWGYSAGSSSVQIPLKAWPLNGMPPACSATIVSECITGTTQPLLFTSKANSTLGVGPITPYVAINVLDNNGAPVTPQATGAVFSIPAPTAIDVSMGIQ